MPAFDAMADIGDVFRLPLDQDGVTALPHGRFARGAGAGEWVEHGAPGGVTRRTSQRMRATGLTVGCLLSARSVAVALAE